MRVGIIQELSENSQRTKDGGEAVEETNNDAGRDRARVVMDLKLAFNALSVMKVIAERDKGDPRSAENSQISKGTKQWRRCGFRLFSH